MAKKLVTPDDRLAIFGTGASALAGIDLNTSEEISSQPLGQGISSGSVVGFPPGVTPQSPG
jgi:hypothetical protein